MNFNGNATGDSVAALLYGWVAGGSRTETILIRSRANSMGMYVQDDWKITPKLSVNLGLRWDLDTPRFEAIDNRQNSFDEQGHNPVCDCPGVITWSGPGTLAEAAGTPTTSSTDNVGPRVGLSYRATDDWVIRAGASIVYIGAVRPSDAGGDERGLLDPRIFRNAASDRRRFPAQGTACHRSPCRRKPIWFQDSARCRSETAAVRAAVLPNPRTARNPYLLTYNFNIQRRLPGDMLFEIGYLSTIGHKLTIPGGPRRRTRSILP